MATAEAEHALLELAAGTGAARRVLGEYPGQPGGARAASLGLHAAKVKAQVGGFVERALELAIRDDGGQVGERAGGGGDGMPCLLLTSSSSSADRCTITCFLIVRPPDVGTVTSIRGPLLGRRPHRQAALRWLNTARSPTDKDSSQE